MFKPTTLLCLLALLSAPALAAETTTALTKEPIKIGEMFAYTALPDSAKKWQQGWKLALDEVNAQGGVLGKPLEVISRDDKGQPSEAIKILEDYKNREGIKIFFGTAHGHVGLAASTFAKQNHMLLVRGYGGTSELTSTLGHDLFLTLQPPCDAWAGILAQKAVESGKKRWAFVVADYATGRSVVEGFQKKLKQMNPDVTFVETQYFPIGKLDAGSVAQAVGHAKPDGLFVVMFGSDYLRFVREGRKRGLFDDKLVVGPYAGYDGYIKPLGKEAPVGWYSADAYPLDIIQDEQHRAFMKNFSKAYDEDPDLSSLYGYIAIKLLAEAVNKVGSDDPDAVVRYIKSHSFDMPSVKLTFRGDGISNIGDWAGYTGFKNGVPTILDPTYFPSDKYLPSVEENLKSREGQK